MLKNLLTVGSWTLLSRILGLVRDQLLAAFLGAGPIQDAYQIAFRLPNMFRRLFGEGAFNAAFIPIFTSEYEKNGAKNALSFANHAFTFLFLLLSILVILGEIFMPNLIHFIAPGFAKSGAERFSLAIILTRITLPYTIFICLAALTAGMLNSRHYFSAASAAYLAFNIVGIASIFVGVFFHFSLALSGAIGITFSGIVQLTGLIWAAKKANINPHFCVPHFTKEVHLLIKKMIPGLIGSGVTQLNLTIDTIISTLLPAGSISWLYFADRLNQLPLGVLGAALGTTLLPLLTRYVAQNNKGEIQNTLNNALEYALILTMPASIGLFSLAPEIIASLFGYGHFLSRDILYCAQSLRAYTLGLPAFIIIKLLTPAFFAQGDTSTPVKIGFFTLFLNLILNLMLYHPLAHIGPPLASAMAAFANMLILGILLLRQNILKLHKNILKKSCLIFIASLIMGLWSIFFAQSLLPLLYGSSKIWQTPLILRLFFLSLTIITSAIIYGAILLLTKVTTIAALKNKIRRRY